MLLGSRRVKEKSVGNRGERMLRLLGDEPNINECLVGQPKIKMAPIPLRVDVLSDNGETSIELPEPPNRSCPRQRAFARTNNGRDAVTKPRRANSERVAGETSDVFAQAPGSGEHPEREFDVERVSSGRIDDDELAGR
jgi:hypothetical protein